MLELLTTLSARMHAETQFNIYFPIYDPFGWGGRAKQLESLRKVCYLVTDIGLCNISILISDIFDNNLDLEIWNDGQEDKARVFGPDVDVNLNRLSSRVQAQFTKYDAYEGYDEYYEG